MLLYEEGVIDAEEMLLLNIKSRRFQLGTNGSRFSFASLDDDKCVSMFSKDDVLFLYGEGAIDEDELLLLWTESGRRPQLCADENNIPFNFLSLTNEQSISMFRFEKHDIIRLYEVLEIPDKIVCRNKTVSSGLESLCITLRRMAYPCRFANLVPIFGRSESELSLIFNTQLDFLFAHYCHKLQTFNQQWMQQDELYRFADAVHHLCPLENCWGFIDGTLRPVSRPTCHQELLFSGHKRVHGLKFQSIVAPNGLIANLYGPIEGKRHDAAVLRESGILPELEANMNTVEGQPFCLYGDAAYALHTHLLTPYKGNNISADATEFNKQMSGVRQCVEWGFSKVIQLFACLDLKKKYEIIVATSCEILFSCRFSDQLSCVFIRESDWDLL